MESGIMLPTHKLALLQDYTDNLVLLANFLKSNLFKAGKFCQVILLWRYYYYEVTIVKLIGLVNARILFAKRFLCY